MRDDYQTGLADLVNEKEVTTALVACKKENKKRGKAM